MSLQTRLEALVAAIGADVKSIRTVQKRDLQGTAPTTPTIGTSVEWTADGKSLDMKASDGVVTRIGPSAGGGGTGTKVSALPAAGVLDGTELVPIVQGGVTDRTTVATLRPWNEQILTAIYTNATLTETDVFVGFAPRANTRYLIDALLTVQANAVTTGVQAALAGPTTGLTRSAVKIISSSAATTDKIDHLAVNGFQVAVAGLATPSLLSIQAIVEVGATPGVGNLRVQARSEVAIANGVQIFPGSSMRWRVI